MRIAVCVATFQRPVMLAALLDSLAALRLDPSIADVIVVVVDNDPACTSRHVIEPRAASFPFPITVGVEPRRNIALARNRCIELALDAGADFLAFVDDDERATPGWLTELLRVRESSGADVVAGPVLNAYGTDAPHWMVAAGLPRHPRLATGTSIGTAETSNVLVARHVFGIVPGFDPGFGISGGSDSHFFLRASAAGLRMVWADDAIVHETIPASRATQGWLLRRAFRVGNAGVHVARAVMPARRWIPRRLVAAAYRIARGVATLPVAAVRGRGALVLSLQDLCLGAGAITAMTGYRYAEYRRSHGE